MRFCYLKKVVSDVAFLFLMIMFCFKLKLLLSLWSHIPPVANVLINLYASMFWSEIWNETNCKTRYFMDVWVAVLSLVCVISGSFFLSQYFFKVIFVLCACLCPFVGFYVSVFWLFCCVLVLIVLVHFSCLNLFFLCFYLSLSLSLFLFPLCCSSLFLSICF